MATITAHEKRIRRRITGRTQEFFVATAPGLEDLCCHEIRSLPVALDNIVQSKGGVSFQGRVHDAYQANLHLRTANRILMRMVEFKATNFRHLKKRLSKIEWELYLPSNEVPKILVSASHSRLFHTDAIASCFQEAIQERFSGLKFTMPACVDKKNQQAVYVRISDDFFTLSIDSSGDLLYKRGLKSHGARAPLRETIAAAALKLAGYKKGELLIDPMCGSGTFSLEGAMMANEMPAGWFRTFAFQAWPCFRPERWRHIRRQVEEKIAYQDQVSIFSSDTDETACRGLADAVREYGLQKTVSVLSRNFFDLSATDCTPRTDRIKTGLVVINPPYGMRIGTRKDSRKIFDRILEKLAQDFLGWKFALVVPREMMQKKMLLKMKVYPVFHGGVHLVIAVGRVPNPA